MVGPSKGFSASSQFSHHEFMHVMPLSSLSLFGLALDLAWESKWGHSAACSHRLYRSQRDEWSEWKETRIFYGNVNFSLVLYFFTCGEARQVNESVLASSSSSLHLGIGESLNEGFPELLIGIEDLWNEGLSRTFDNDPIR